MVAYFIRLEKLNPTFDLSSIQAEFSSVDRLRMTRTAAQNSAALGIELEDVVTIIRSIQRTNFYKSMTTYHDHRLWQDVYHVPHEEIILYVKFTIDDVGHIVVSFKAKD